jgi:hypothetical protein
VALGLPLGFGLGACGVERGGGGGDGVGGGEAGQGGGDPGQPDEGAGLGGREGEGEGEAADPAGAAGGLGDAGVGVEGGDEGGTPGGDAAGEAGAEAGDAGGQDGGGEDGPPGVVVEVERLRPSEGPFSGGNELTLTGKGLVGVQEIKIGGNDGFIIDRADRTLLFRAPMGDPGPAAVKIQFEDQLLTLPRSYMYLGPSPDGVLAEWPDHWWAPEEAPDEELNDESGLVRMAAVSDGHTLYIAIIGFATQEAAIVGYVDLDPGAGTGLKEMDRINPAGGALDTALSNRVVAEGGLGAELAFGTVGMWSSPEQGSPLAGWRNLADPENPRWVEGQLSALVASYTLETSVSLPPAVAGQDIAVCVRIVTADGQRLSNETLPPDNPALPAKWSESYIVRVPER